jgi:hypothetical protein
MYHLPHPQLITDESIQNSMQKYILDYATVAQRTSVLVVPENIPVNADEVRLEEAALETLDAIDIPGELYTTAFYIRCYFLLVPDDDAQADEPDLPDHGSEKAAGNTKQHLRNQ